MGSRRKKSPARPKANVKLPSIAARLLKRLHGSLSLDLRHSDYPVDVEEFYWATLGHCYIASEAIYYLWAKKAGYVPYVLKHDFGTHWWLVHKDSGAILDPTEPQMDGDPFPYHEGRRATFLTTKPSRRAQELIRRMQRR